MVFSTTVGGMQSAIVFAKIVTQISTPLVFEMDSSINYVGTFGNRKRNFSRKQRKVGI